MKTNFQDINKIFAYAKGRGVKIVDSNKKGVAFWLVGKMHQAEKDKEKIDNIAKIISDYYNKKWKGSELYKCVSHIGLYGEYVVTIKRYSI